MNDATRTWLDDAARPAALRAEGVAATTSTRTYVRLRPDDVAVVAFDVRGADPAVPPARAYVRLFLGDRAEEAAALADKWTRLRPVATPFGAGVRPLSDGRGALFFFPNDAGLRGLKDVLDPDKLKRAVAALPAFADRVRLKAADLALDVVRWKPERRLVATLRASTRDVRTGARGSVAAIVRYFPDDRGALLAATVSALRRAPDPPPVPTSFGSSDDGRLYVESLEPGVSLEAELLRGGADLRPVAVAEAVARLHAAPAPPWLRALDPLADAFSAVADLARLAPSLAARAAACGAALARRVPRPTTAPATLHGDLHPGQILLGADGVRLVDFERAATGDPAADVGALVAELLVFGEERPSARDAARGFTSRFLAAHAERGLGRGGSSLPYFVAAALVRRALLPLRRADVDAAARASALLVLAEQSLGLAAEAPVVVAARAAEPAPKAAAAETPALLYPRPGAKGEWPCAFTASDRVVAHGLYDPARRTARVVSPAEDPALPTLGAWAARGAILARRVGRRALVRVGGPDDPRYVKLLPRDKAARTAAAQEIALASARGADPDLPRFAPLLDASADEGALHFGRLAGEELSRLLLRDAPDADAAIARTARALAAWQKVPVARPRLAPTTEAPPEAWRDLVGAHDPEGASTAPFDDLLGALPPLPAAEAETLVHGDLHDGNVLVPREGRVGVLDLDLLHHGDPARDVGNLAAHLVLRTLEAAKAATRDARARGLARAEAFLKAYRAARGPASTSASAAAAARAAFRLACLYRFRAPADRFTTDLLAAAARFAETDR